MSGNRAFEVVEPSSYTAERSSLENEKNRYKNFFFIMSALLIVSFIGNLAQMMSKGGSSPTPAPPSPTPAPAGSTPAPTSSSRYPEPNYEVGAGYFGLINAEYGTARCTNIIKDTLTVHADDMHPSSMANVSARIGQILGAQYSWKDTSGTFAEDCCARGTEYDHMLLSEVDPVTTESQMNVVDDKTMLIIVDMQNDFTTGSFGQACWSQGGSGFSQKMVDVAKAMAKKGATIVASKDFHPHDHCSFETADMDKKCENVKDKNDNPGRYTNFFPSHTSYTIVGGKAVPQKGEETPFCKTNAGLPFCADKDFEGAAFDKDIRAGLQDMYTEHGEDKVKVVFKGFNQAYDSFSAIAHLASANALEQKLTGGYSLSSDRMKSCWEKNNLEDSACQPTEEELNSVAGDSPKMEGLDEIVRDKKIERLYVVGLVWDFCVKETAIFAREMKDLPVGNANKREIETTVLADLTRPSFDGKPGAPFTATACGGLPTDREGDFCLAGGGTFRAHAKVYEEYRNIDVKVVRLQDPKSGVSKSAAFEAQV